MASEPGKQHCSMRWSPCFARKLSPSCSRLHNARPKFQDAQTDALMGPLSPITTMEFFE
jgi:hypothetical protein